MTDTIFEKARKLYPGVRRGYDTELLNLKKHHRDWKAILPLLLPAIEKQILWRKSANGEFRPEWKYFQTWINNRCWEDEVDAVSQKQPRLCQCGCGKEAHFTYLNEHWHSAEHRNRMKENK